MTIGKMRLIADSGSTKTTWVLITGSEDISWSTVGLNPFFHTEQSATTAIMEGWYAHAGSIPFPSEVHFYGAGCGKAERSDLILKWLQHGFQSSRVFVSHDMLAAARALFGFESGLCGILGTGSNFCVYTNGEITENPVSLGYILGDHGSGNHIGKQFLTSFFEGTMPYELQREFQSQFNLEISDVLDRIYRQPMPNKYLASFAIFGSRFLSHPWIINVVQNCFEDYVVHQIRVTQSTKAGMHFGAVGSIARGYAAILKPVIERHGFVWVGAQANPIEQLTELHRN